MPDAENKVYWRAAAALAVLLILSLATTVVDLGRFALSVALSIAAVKVFIVATYFMHLRWGSRLSRLFAVSGLFWFVILLAFTFFECATRSTVGT